LHQSWRKIASLLMAGTLLLGVAACGGDDDDDDVASGDDDTTETTEASGDTTDTTEATGICAELPPSEEAAEGATKTTIIAEDYEFFAAEALALGGQQAVTLINNGEEIHELFIGLIDPSETRTIDELLASAEQPDTVEMIGVGVACPGQRSTFNADLSAPGRYVAICNVPVGTTPDSDPEAEPSGPPHAMEGMVYEFEIAAA
jgi:hypothetical protein